jgi:hypothetical protein
MKLIQFLETPVFNSDIEVLTITDLGKIMTPGKSYPTHEAIFYEGMQMDRGEGGFGSSDKKKNK